jgi:signal transduction histidine kinase
MVVQAGRRARDLVDLILTFSRRGELAKSPLDLGDVLREVLKLMRSTLPATIDIRPNIRDTPAQILADGSQIHQVLINLCTNAGQAMEEDGGTLAGTLDRIDVAAAAIIA